MRNVYKIIGTESELNQLIQHCKTTGFASIDFETSGHKMYRKEFHPTILGVSFQQGSSWIIPLGHKESVFKDQWPRILRIFSEEVIMDPDITKFCWNGLWEYRIFLKYKTRPRGRFHDAMLMKYLLNEERPHDLKSTVDYMLPDFAGYDLPNQPGRKATEESLIRFWSNVDLEELSEYCALDCDSTLRLGIHFQERLMNHKLYHLFRNFYSPLIRILSDTILQGVNIDRKYLQFQNKEFAAKLEDIQDDLFHIPEVHKFMTDFQEERVNDYINQLEDEIDSGDLTPAQEANREKKISNLLAGIPTTKKEEKLFEPLNLSSPPQLIRLLYTSESGFEFPILDRSEGGNPSTAEDTLLKLRDYDESGFIDGLLDYRGKATVYSTFIKGIYEEALTDDDKIHPSYLLHGTVTGRLSSREPNMQNIPRVTTDNYVKPMFVAPKDHFFMEADGSQMELRVAAEMSGDPVMMEIFEKGQNIHVATAAKMFGVDYAWINKARKDDKHPDHLDAVKKHKAAKVLNFTIFYGAGPPTVGRFLSKSTGDHYTSQGAQEFIDLWFEAFPDTARWIKLTRKKAMKQGYIVNPFGRKRRLPIFLEPRNKQVNKGAWNQALRLAVNAPIQGAASDVTQWVGIQMYLAILRGEIPGYLRTVSTVHDSNEYYPHKTDVHIVANKVFEVGSQLPDLYRYMGYQFSHVPMKFSAEVGINWGRMHEYNPDIDYKTFYDAEWEAYNKEPFPHIIY